MTHEEELSQAIRDTEARLKRPLYCGHPAANIGDVDAQRDARVECKVCKEIAGLKGQLEAARRKEQPGLELQVRFDGPPGPESGRFVELETLDGCGNGSGEWVQDGEFWLLRIRCASASNARGVPVEKVFAWADRLDGMWSPDKAGRHELLANEMRQAARYAEPAGRKYCTQLGHHDKCD